MKQIILISTLIIGLLSCKAQQIVPIFDHATPEHNSNKYYKDVDNDMNKFEGIWKYVNGTTEFKIVLEKKLAVNNNDGDFIYDLLVGEYLYKENNAEIINTLDDIDDTSITPRGHNIGGYGIYHKYNNPRCEECDITERRVRLLVSKPSDPNAYGWLTLRYINDNGVEKLEAIIQDCSIMGSDPRSKLDIPYGEYVLIKE